MYNIYAIVILILFDIPCFSVNDLHQIQVAAPSPSSRKSFQLPRSLRDLDEIYIIYVIKKSCHLLDDRSL